MVFFPAHAAVLDDVRGLLQLYAALHLAGRVSAYSVLSLVLVLLLVWVVGKVIGLW